MKRDYNIRQVPSKKQLVIRPRQSSSQSNSQFQTRVLTQPTQLLTSSLLKIAESGMKLKLSAKNSLDSSIILKQSISNHCPFCHTYKTQYMDILKSIQSTVLLSKQWMSGTLTNKAMLERAEKFFSDNETLKELQQTLLHLMHDLESMSKVDIQKLIPTEQFDEYQEKPDINNKISEAKDILNSLRKEYGAEVNSQIILMTSGYTMSDLITRNLKARLGCILRQYKQMKQDNHRLKDENWKYWGKQKQNEIDREKEKEKEKERKQKISRQKDKFKELQRIVSKQKQKRISQR